ncbi:hypothetical protein GCM10027514_37040 [Azotobacter armeniacus]
MKQAREAWVAEQPWLDPARIVFIDETGASTKMARLYGRALRGERCLAAILHDKVAGVRQAIEGAGATLRYLPPYSPDLNPIEMAFSKLTSLLRKAAARTLPELWQSIGEAITQFSAEDCRHYFKAAGYESE